MEFRTFKFGYDRPMLKYNIDSDGIVWCAIQNFDCYVEFTNLPYALIPITTLN